MLTAVAELSLTVPIVNTLAFLFTVLGEWWVESKVISKGEYLSKPGSDPVCPVRTSPKGPAFPRSCFGC